MSAVWKLKGSVGRRMLGYKHWCYNAVNRGWERGFNMIKFTAGPWIAVSNNNKTMRIESVYGIPIIEEGYLPTEHNSKLIAKSPELFQALTDCVDCMEKILNGRNDCGNPDIECPLQDAGSNDNNSMRSILDRSKSILEAIN